MMPSANMASSWGFQLRLPRPKTFLGLLSLQTGTELISLALLLNKVTGLYGLLAILTGYSLSPLQLATYIYSIGVLGLLAFLLPHIRRQSPLECLGLAWLYIIDTTVNVACTTAFAVNWYLLEPSHTSQPDGEAPAEWHVGPTDTLASLAVIVFFTLIRVYFVFGIMAFAQQVLQRQMETESLAGKAVTPFSEGSPAGDGWRGRLGRSLTSVGRSYWLHGGDGEEEWTRGAQAKFRSPGSSSASPVAAGEA